MDKVFVITVCRNAGGLLEPTLLSVLNQTYKNLKYIIVDGGSTDGTVEIIQKYEDKLAAWVSEPDKGIYDAMNKGLIIVKGLLNEGETAWINFMGAGDGFISDEVVEDIFGDNGVLNTRQHRDKVIVIGGNTKDRFYGDRYSIHHAESPEVLSNRLAFSHQSCFVIFGKNQQLSGNDNFWRFNTKYRYAADYNLLHHLNKKYGSEAFLIVNKVIAYYRQEDSSSLVNRKRSKREYLLIQRNWTSLFWWKEVIKHLLNV